MKFFSRTADNNLPWPNLYVVGAPKCGTSTVYDWMKAHPQIFVSPVKEPGFFSDGFHRRVESKENYLRLFRGASHKQAYLAEASTRYLYSTKTFSQILNVSPGAKFVVCIRNPLEMLVSLHLQEQFSGNEDVPDLREAWRLVPYRRMGLHLPKSCRSAKHLAYDVACSLGSALNSMLTVVPRKNVFVIVMDDLVSDQGEVFRDLACFLRIQDIGNLSIRSNVSKRRRSRRLGALVRVGADWKLRLGITRSFGLSRLNAVKTPRPVRIDVDFKRELLDFFERDVRRLEATLGRSLQDWRKV